LAQALQARNLPPVGGGAIAYFVVMCFLLGILMVWLYAAVRPRLGPDPKTGCPGSHRHHATAADAVRPRMGLVEFLIASLVGARLYRET
jgi:hypothetical protein